jgi:hypothetical protein
MVPIFDRHRRSSQRQLNPKLSMGRFDLEASALATVEVLDRVAGFSEA